MKMFLWFPVWGTVSWVVGLQLGVLTWGKDFFYFINIYMVANNDELTLLFNLIRLLSHYYDEILINPTFGGEALCEVSVIQSYSMAAKLVYSLSAKKFGKQENLSSRLQIQDNSICDGVGFQQVLRL